MLLKVTSHSVTSHVGKKTQNSLTPVSYLKKVTIIHQSPIESPQNTASQTPMIHTLHRIPLLLPVTPSNQPLKQTISVTPSFNSSPRHSSQPCKTAQRLKLTTSQPLLPSLFRHPPLSPQSSRALVPASHRERMMVLAGSPQLSPLSTCLLIRTEEDIEGEEGVQQDEEREEEEEEGQKNKGGMKKLNQYSEIREIGHQRVVKGRDKKLNLLSVL